MITLNDFNLSEKDYSLLKEKFKTQKEINSAIERLKKHEPLAYIIGEWYFYNEIYKVSPDCLIPRPESEHLVDELIKNLPKNGKFADLCTGSGCIAISVLANRQDCSAVAIDISFEALKLAEYNAVLNNVSDRIKFINSDILNEKSVGNEKFDIIVSNPPYIKTEIIQYLQEELQYEPKKALDGGSDGLDFYKKIFTCYKENVNTGGYIICEIGYDQGKEMRELFGCEIKKDYSNNDRVAILKI